MGALVGGAVRLSSTMIPKKARRGALRRQEIKHSPKPMMVLCLAAMYVLTRAIALSPLFILQGTALFGLGDKLSLIARGGICLVLWVVLVAPERVYARRELKGDGAHSGYGFCLKRAMARLVRVMPLLIPVLALGGLFVYLFWFDDFTSLRVLKQIAELVGASGNTYDMGAALVVVPLLVLALVLMYVWHRGVPYDYVADKKVARRITKSACFRRLSLLNALLVLLPVALFALVLGTKLYAGLTLGRGMVSLVTSMMGALKQMLNYETMTLMALVFVLVYLPTYFIRKHRTAVLCAAMEDEDAA